MRCATLLTVMVAGLPWETPVRAGHISVAVENVLRTRLPGEGYLTFQKATGGEERTGWTDIRHPSLLGQAGGLNDPVNGYDRSDHFVTVETHLVKDDNNVTAAALGIPDDFDFANRVWVQAGLSVLEVKHDTVRVNGVTFPIDPGVVTFAELGTIFDAATSGSPVINAWYITGFDDVGQTGEANVPSSASIRDPGFAVTFGRNVTTFSHELGHFLLDSVDHSADPRNIMASGDDRYFPGRGRGQGNVPPFNIAKSLDVVGMPMSNNPDGSPKVGGVEQLTRAQAVDALTDSGNPNPYIQYSDEAFHAADRADFDWVEDNAKLEGIAIPGDNHPAGGAVDDLIWRIGPIAFPPEPGPTPQNGGHDHDSWGALNLPTFRGKKFKVVDVVSQIARYADSDIDTSGARSRREAALDYDIWFSKDGADWRQVFEPLTIFKPGWTHISAAEDYLARWVAPIDDARFVKIRAHRGGFHDSNTQIDAVIAATAVAEPGTLALLMTGAVALAASRLTSRTRRSRRVKSPHLKG